MSGTLLTRAETPGAGERRRVDHLRSHGQSPSARVARVGSTPPRVALAVPWSVALVSTRHLLAWLCEEEEEGRARRALSGGASTRAGALTHVVRVPVGPLQPAGALVCARQADAVQPWCHAAYPRCVLVTEHAR